MLAFLQGGEGKGEGGLAYVARIESARDVAGDWRETALKNREIILAPIALVMRYVSRLCISYGVRCQKM